VIHDQEQGPNEENQWEVVKEKKKKRKNKNNKNDD
jgi:hypothetical protein